MKDNYSDMPPEITLLYRIPPFSLTTFVRLVFEVATIQAGFLLTIECAKHLSGLTLGLCLIAVWMIVGRCWVLALDWRRAIHIKLADMVGDDELQELAHELDRRINLKRAEKDEFISR